ncbi:MAG: hypothetical protein AC479_03695 [miscellaneous Crenarchaeota group-6 archaeon AD8-1]|nr:MAG: hypothetical protein AC479_03695 [miscellaneous Crenarchaeota group-6 archaeon AD8-1]
MAKKPIDESSLLNQELRKLKRYKIIVYVILFVIFALAGVIYSILEINFLLGLITILITGVIISLIIDKFFEKQKKILMHKYGINEKTGTHNHKKIRTKEKMEDKIERLEKEIEKLKKRTEKTA